MPAIAKRVLRPPTRMTPELAAKIMDEVASGPSLAEVCKKPGYPTARTFHRWVREHEELYSQWEFAKQMRAHALFDEAIDLAKTLIYKDMEGGQMFGGRNATQNQIRAVQVAVETLKDAAAKLNPQDYGQRRTTEVVVPIQIVTNMNMGQEGKPAQVEGTSIYELTAPAVQVTDAPQN